MAVPERESDARLEYGTTVWPLSEYSLIGRWDDRIDSDPDIDLSDLDTERSVSRRHAVIQRTREVFILRDLGSANGTILDGQRLLSGQLAELFDGSCITVGDLVLVFRAAPTNAENHRSLRGPEADVAGGTVVSGPRPAGNPPR